MRFLPILVLVMACGKGGPAAPPAAYRFLPASPELVVHLDLTRVRAWSQFERVAPLALADLKRVLAGLAEHCSLDPIAEARDVIVARRGPLLGGDATVIASGLPRAKLTGCLAKILAASTVVTLTLDGDLVHIKLAGRAIASGAILPSGELVLVMRGGAGVEPEAWKTEVTKGAIALPAWVSELDLKAPIAIRTANDQRTLTASVTLGDPLLLRGKMVNPTPEAAQKDVANARAIIAYLAQGDAGVGRLEPKATTTHFDLTATGAQIEHLLAIALPVVLGGGVGLPDDLGTPPTPVTDPTTGAPVDCASLGAAVAAYINESMSLAPPDRRAEMAAGVDALIPALQKAFVGNCTEQAWAPASIECHVQNAKSLPKFEQCRQTLTTAQRERLDQALQAALTAPPPKP